MCGDQLEAVRLQCRHCATTIEGRFTLGGLARLDPEQVRFVETFLKVRGNLKEMERELGVSYPTVRARLDAILQAMGYAVEAARAEESAERRREVLDQLQAGQITVDEAVRLLRGRR
ncbi:MAG: DUF2089 domain-containing protein [Armatimonadota bacterium]|nr:DUF2089 domain-containing protein [Armatimonadota bacterium]MDR7487684.1 DUF2089 domain-containing protein [Armatimonadota bacterium]MDR7575124.1 DUF2089 domain-containing protein [Armatimonadota bacterium]MDR7592349.1 DUF2089 domain-containing protein [Armatimonadota bacterium]